MDSVVASLSGLEPLGNGLTGVGHPTAFHLSGIIGQPYTSVGSQYTGVALKESISAKSRGKIDFTTKHSIEGIIPQLVPCLVELLSNEGQT
jgi:hypothetical protein